MYLGSCGHCLSLLSDSEFHKGKTCFIQQDISAQAECLAHGRWTLKHVVKGMNYLMKEQDEERREYLAGAGQETLSFKFPSKNTGNLLEAGPP